MILTESNFILYAAKHYDLKKSTGIEEFQEDLKRFQYIKRLLRKYRDADDLKLRLILNHVVVLYNCFGKEATNLLFFKLPEFKPQVKALAAFLNYMPEYIQVGTTLIKNSEVDIDQVIYQELRKL
jgi:hypothetical protein